MKKRFELPRRYTDAELFVAEFVRNDANSIPNLTNERLPEGVQIVDVFSCYRHANYPAEKIFCCVCGFSRHQLGFHIGRSDQLESTLGSCCAKAKLGAEYVKAASRLKGEQTRQTYIRAIYDFQPTALRILHSLMLDRWRDLSRQIRAARYALSQAFPDEFAIMQDCARHNSPLIMRRRALDVQRTNSRDHSDTEHDSFVWEHVPAFRISGPEFFDRGDPVEVIEDFTKLLRNFSLLGRNTDKHSTADLRRYVKSLQLAHERFARILVMQAAAERFFSNAHLKAIAGWINNDGEGGAIAHASANKIENVLTGKLAEKPAFVSVSHDLLEALQSLRKAA